MSDVLTISGDEIIHQVKLSCEIPSIVEQTLRRKIVARVAETQGIQVEPDELQQAADNLRLINNLLSAGATESWLQKHSLSLDEFEELVQATIVTSKLAQHLFADNVESYFVEHQLNYAQVVMYEVVLDDQDLALELFYALQEGEINFHQAAHQYIQNPDLRRSGGYRGLLGRTALKPEISAAVFATSPPQILKPIVTSKGAHLILVEEIIQPQLDNVLRYKILSDLFSAWLKEQIEQAEFLTQFDSNLSIDLAALPLIPAC